MKNIFIWIKNNISKIILILSAPFVIILFLRLGNFISAQTGINLNPSGVGNTEWFLFWAAYIAGICTLIAFLSTVKQNQRELQYNAEMHSIEKEQEILSNVITGLYIREIYDLVEKLILIEDVDLLESTTYISQLLFLIIETKKKLILANQRLIFDAEIYNKGCATCINITTCKRGQLSKEFMNNYGKIYSVFFQNINILYTYLSDEKRLYDIIKSDKYYSSEVKKFKKMMLNVELNSKNEGFSIDGDMINEQNLSSNDSIKKMNNLLNKHQDESNKIRRENKILWSEIKKFIFNIQNYEKQELVTIMDSAKNYIMIRKINAKERLEGRTILAYIPVEGDRNTD